MLLLRKLGYEWSFESIYAILSQSRFYRNLCFFCVNFWGLRLLSPNFLDKYDVWCNLIYSERFTCEWVWEMLDERGRRRRHRGSGWCRSWNKQARGFRSGGEEDLNLWRFVSSRSEQGLRFLPKCWTLEGRNQKVLAEVGTSIEWEIPKTSFC